MDLDLQPKEGNDEREDRMTKQKNQIIHHNIYQDDYTGGWIALARGLYDQERKDYPYINLGIYGTREAAMNAVKNSFIMTNTLPH